jgi:hypothetical protein
VKSFIARLAALSLFLAAAIVPVTPARADQSRNLDWSGPLAAGAQLSVSGINGDIVADAAPGQHASLRAHVSSKLGDISAVRLQVKQLSNGVAICSVLPGEKVSEDCSHSDYSSDGDGDHEIRVDFTLHVPRGVNLQAKTVNGRASAEGLSGNVAARTVNGSIAIATSGYANAKTVNGKIEVHIGNPNWSGGLAFKTVNGAIHLWLPRGANFTVAAKTLNGGIDAGAFHLGEDSGRWFGHKLDGKVGKGGRALTLQTVNGAISLGAN